MLGVSEMFLATRLLIDHNADGAFGDIPDDTGAAVVELVRHALVHGAVHLDVHIVADLVVAQVSRQVDISFVPEGTREQIPGPRPQSMTGRHSCSLLSTCFLSSSSSSSSALGSRDVLAAKHQEQEENVHGTLGVAIRVFLH